jgi:hypothetical protein
MASWTSNAPLDININMVYIRYDSTPVHLCPAARVRSWEGLAVLDWTARRAR